MGEKYEEGNRKTSLQGGCLSSQRKQRDEPAGRRLGFRMLRKKFPLELVSFPGRRDGDFQHLHFSEKLYARKRMETGKHLPNLTLEGLDQELLGGLPVLHPVLVNLGC